jgi:hypothetical protein
VIDDGAEVRARDGQSVIFVVVFLAHEMFLL